MKKILFSGAAVVALSIAAFGGTGCPGGDGDNDAGVAFTTHTIDNGDYTLSAATNINDGCNVDPNGASPIQGTKQAITYDAATGKLSIGANAGTPPAPSNGEGFLSDNKGTLLRENTVDAGGGCTFTRHVENAVTVTGDNALSSNYTRTDTNHTAACVDQTTDCTTTWSYTLTK